MSTACITNVYSLHYQRLHARGEQCLLKTPARRWALPHILVDNDASPHICVNGSSMRSVVRICMARFGSSHCLAAWFEQNERFNCACLNVNASIGVRLPEIIALFYRVRSSCVFDHSDLTVSLKPAACFNPESLFLAVGVDTCTAMYVYWYGE